MPTPKNCRKGGHEKSYRKGLSSEKASSFHGRTGRVVEEGMLPRPRTVPDLVARKRVGAAVPDVVLAMQERRELTKLLLNVTIQRSLGAVQVVMPPEATVEDLIAAALRQYSKEGRRLILPSTDPTGFDLHYSQFSLESLNREEKLLVLGSRNFFLCPKKAVEASRDGGHVTRLRFRVVLSLPRLMGCRGSSSWRFYCEQVIGSTCTSNFVKLGLNFLM